MKLTVEIPDEILQRAKTIAMECHTTLSELILEGLQHVLNEKSVSASVRAKRLFQEMDSLPRFSSSKRLTRSESHER